jgi:hypothetical protein
MGGKMCDGWNEEIKEELKNRVFDEWDNVSYEVQNCVKGCYTGAKNRQQLAEYLQGMAETLNEVAEWLKKE